MITAKDLPRHTKPADSYLRYWEPSGIYTLTEDVKLQGDGLTTTEKLELGLKPGASTRHMAEVTTAKAGEVLVEYWREDEKYESGKREGFLKSVEHIYVHVPTGKRVTGLYKDGRLMRDHFRDGTTHDWRETIYLLGDLHLTKREYKKVMPEKNKIECEDGCGRTADNCDNEFGRYEA